MYYAGENQLYLNVPVNEGNDQQQYVMNTISKSWCNFTGWEANCWDIFAASPYFGGNTVVCKAWNGNTDNGNNINGNCLQAFSAYGNPGNVKRFSMIRPIFRSDGTPAILGSMNLDFNISISTASLSFSAPTSGLWDSAVWDTATWGGGLSVIQNWQSVYGVGYYGAPQMQISGGGIQVRWVSTDIVYETGAIL